MIELNSLCTGSDCPLFFECRPDIKGWIERGKVGDRKEECEEV